MRTRARISCAFSDGMSCSRVFEWRADGRVLADKQEERHQKHARGNAIKNTQGGTASQLPPLVIFRCGPVEDTSQPQSQLLMSWKVPARTKTKPNLRKQALRAPSATLPWYAGAAAQELTPGRLHAGGILGLVGTEETTWAAAGHTLETSLNPLRRGAWSVSQTAAEGG